MLSRLDLDRPALVKEKLLCILADGENHAKKHHKSKPQRENPYIDKTQENQYLNTIESAQNANDSFTYGEKRPSRLPKLQTSH